MARFMDFHDPRPTDSACGRSSSTTTRRKVYCLLEGPDEEAIRRHHAALGVPAGACTKWTA